MYFCQRQRGRIYPGSHKSFLLPDTQLVKPTKLLHSLQLTAHYSCQSDPHIFEHFSSYKTHADARPIFGTKMMTFLFKQILAQHYNLFLALSTPVYSLT